MSMLTATLFVFTFMRLQQAVQLQQYQIPKEREGFFNKTAYVRIIPPFNFHRQIGLNFRTCAGGQLFTQTYPHSNDQISLEVSADSLKLTVFYANKVYDAELKGHFLDNNWHTVNVIAKVNNITLSSGSFSQTLANSSYNVELLNPDISLVTNSKNSKLIVGQGFIGCLLDGPGIIFNSSSNQAYNVEWGPCPYNANVCAQVDYCSSEPCMMHGTCISHTDHYQCICGARYSGSVCEIDRGSPCRKGNNPCINNGRCEEDRIGNYECICEPGYTGVHCETELTSRLCEANPCQNNGFCHVLPPGGSQYECVCVPGFIGKNCETNINECVSSPCMNGGTCIDGINNYTCNCAGTGYKGVNCEININECEEKPCHNYGKCFDTYGSFICECEPGFEGKLCENNVDGCASSPCRNGGFCKNNLGGYECHCRSGYVDRHCQTKLNECENTICPPDSICVDDGIAHHCVCANGFTGISPNCTKITACLNSPCSNNGICTPTSSGDINCTCPPGFIDLTPNKSVPLPIKLYAKYLAFCLFNKTTNYNAFLNAPLRCNKKLVKNRTTININITGSHMVSVFANTSYTYQQHESNVGHRYRCNYNLSRFSVASLFGNDSVHMCNIRNFRLWNAFIRTSKLCQINVDECFSNPCQNGGTCIDGLNGFKCNCTNEFTGPLCQLPLDGCASSPCRNNGSCVTKNKREYKCDCVTGFDGVNCENDIDDCSSNVCPQGKICVDGINSYECRCKDGYTGEDCSIKMDIARCRSNSCINGLCVDTPTGYTCNCSPGYEGFICDKDIDECKLNYCKNGFCINTEGSYQCFCTPGFTGDHCDIDFDECLSHPCSNGATCINGINKFSCICTPGYTGKDCSVDINECDPNPCYNEGNCIDGNASYSCECPSGWAGSVCNINIDDCQSSPCQNGGVCKDGINDYTCDCTKTGYAGTHCEVNIDDCADNPCVNNATCIDKVKDYQCICFAGYAGKNCTDDINECESNPCLNGGTCLEHSKQNLYNQDPATSVLPMLYTHSFKYEIAAGYECLCSVGLTGVNCEININECESNPCRNGKCVDVIGGYTCECEDGFEGKHCEIDVDECERYMPCVHGTCIDRRAGYYCDCSPKYGGKNCSVELAGCNQEHTCLNNGTCKPYLIGETLHRFNCSCPFGFHGPVCENITTMSLSSESNIVVNTTRDEGYDISFRFKTTLPNGLLAIGKGFTFYILELVNGRLNLHSSLLNKWEGVFIGSQLNDSNWQKVFVAINSSHVVLAANEEQTIYPINLNEGANASHTSFPTTYVGGAVPNLRQLTHRRSVFVGCIENIIINAQWVIPQETNGLPIEMQGVQVGCPRRDQCNSNPCHNGGECTDLWKNFSCTCQRPYLGFTCQYNLTAATFGHENITKSLVTVNVSAQAKRTVRNIVDISMFIRTRQLKGAIFYLGSIPGSVSYLEETHIAAELDTGELLVRIQFNGTEESYTVGGVKLNDGFYHLIQVIRNVTLIQVKINGTEYFRKTIGANGPLDAQVLYLGGLPSIHSHNSSSSSTGIVSPTAISSSRSGRQTQNSRSLSNAAVLYRYARQTAERFENIPHFKGVIQDVQISNGSSKMVVEFMPLENKSKDVVIPKPFGSVSFNPALVLEGAVSDNTCASNPCFNNAQCTVTWNDYVCKCPIGYKGKQCQEMEFCQLQDCPIGSECRNLNHGYECVANITLGGATDHFLQYSLRRLAEKQEPLNSIDITYRSKTGGTLLYISNSTDTHQSLQTKHFYFAVFVFKDQVTVTWELDATSSEQYYKIKKDHADGEWTSINIKIADNKMHCSFAGVTDEPGQYFSASNFSSLTWNNLISSSNIYIGGGDSYLQEFSVLYDGDFTNSLSDTSDVLTPASSVDEYSIRPSGMHYKGCIGEVRIGSLLLPYFTDRELNASIQTDKDYFTLLRSVTEEKSGELGCYLCSNVDCKNGGRCKNGIESYDCECAAGFSGDDCSHNVDECLQSKCLHGATCIDSIANYTCQCTTGWTGWLCDIDIDECASDPCRNNGTCIDHLGFYECNCTEEFVGKQCDQMKQITCESRPCKNDAVCSDTPNVNTGDNYTCSCLDGFVGIYCDDTFCSVKPCRNRGLCVIKNKAPMCECSAGFEGKYCEDNINDCIPAPDGTPPCLHKGRCIDDIDSYYCNCTGTGYTGQKCDTDIDECMDGIANCGKKGKCENLEGSYRCKCEKDVCGYHCDLCDPCREMPCQNGGTCQESCTNEPDYECTCSPGYVGKNCTELPLYSPERVADIAFIVGPILAVLLIIGGIALSMFVMMARKKRATRGTYSPSSQEYCNPRVELDNVMKPPPEERLI